MDETNSPDGLIGRRTFLRAALGSSVLLGTGTAVLAASTAPASGSRGGKKPVTRNRLYVPPVVDVGGLTSPYPLTAKPYTIDLGGNQVTNAWVYNESMPGPTFRATRGDHALINLSNQLNQPTITHWHGMVVDHVNDGHPVYAIQPGQSYGYSFTVNQRAALNWYHPHPHLLTGQQVAMGLAGAFIVNDADEAALGLPSGARELPLVIRDASFDSRGNLQYKPRGDGYFGSAPLVNGTTNPYLNVDTAWYRFRVLCGSNARLFELALGNNAPFTLIGNDGGLLPGPDQADSIVVSPGERLDLLVDFSGLHVGDTVMLRDLLTGWDLLQFVVTNQVSDTFTPPTALPTITPLATTADPRIFTFDGMSKINGQVYDMDRIDFQVRLGDVERWRFVTNGNGPHPVHVHGASFQVVSRSGGRNQLYPWEAGWKDTVLLQDAETVDVLIQFTEYRGEYLLHCHKLEHEDNGMMANFEVV